MSSRGLSAILLGVVVLAAPWAFAESTDCGAPVLIVPDGRITQSTIPASTTYWYGIYAQAYHSYSVEFVPAADNFFNNFRPQFNGVTVYSPTDSVQSCRGTSSVVITPNSGYAPAILKNSNGAGRRVSFIAQSSGLYLISATNVMGAGAYSFRAVDTTLINIRWNTMAGNDVQWIIMNISDMPITGTLTIVDMNGQVVTSLQFAIPIGGRVSRTSGNSDLRLPREIAGSVLFTHNGPPGSVLAEAFLLTPMGTLPEKFDPVVSR